MNDTTFLFTLRAQAAALDHPIFKAYTADINALAAELTDPNCPADRKLALEKQQSLMMRARGQVGGL